nr:hypothetical protein StreXyl84_46650 [Streptomyces sp. Xyl84]
MTVVVSSDTDIYISPGLYGDCLPTSATGKAADSFRAGHLIVLLSMLAPFMLAHPPGTGQGPVDGRPRRWRRAGPGPWRRRDSRHIDTMDIVKVT